MKGILKIVLIFGMILVPLKVEAGRGCCSSHGGVVGCSGNGKQICADGTLSPTCRCTPPAVYGCTDRSASNYNSNANQNDGSCIYYVYGCTDKNALNYNKEANKDDNSCKYHISGCTDNTAENYNSLATLDDGSCKYKEEVSTFNTMENESDDSDSSEGGFASMVLGGSMLAGGSYLFKKKKNKR